MLFRTRARIALGALTAVGAVAVAAGSVAATSSSGKQTTGTAYVAGTPKPGSLVYVAGFNTDKVLGPGAVTYALKALPGRASGTIKVNARLVTLWTAKGSLSGTGSATLTITNSPKTGDATVSGGKLKLTHGTGALAGHSLTATFTGKGNVGAGAYVFHYKGTYK